MADLPILDDIENDMAIAEAADNGVKLVIEKVEDLDITPAEIEAENSPFLKEPPLTIKKKKPLSEKQIAHLAKMTENRRQKKLLKLQKDEQKLLEAQEKANKAQYAKQTKPPPKPISEAAPPPIEFDPHPLTEEERNLKIIEDDRNDFMKFMGNMERWKQVKHIIRPKKEPVKQEQLAPIQEEPSPPKKIPNVLRIPRGDDYSYCFN